MKNEPKITPEVIEQHGLTPDEYAHLCKVLGREPNFTELGIASVMWSEHCSYKSSRVHLKTLPTQGPRVLQGPGENAGVVDIGDGQAVCFKIESHNHPSYIEPYQGAATGVGGILRDIFTMGARPIANMNSLRFGAATHPKTKQLLKGVVAGIGGYGNTMGIPTVGGEVAFDECYNGNILVNAFSLGLMDANKIFLGRAHGVGNPVIYFGAKTGRDGIHGATMASEEFSEGSEEKRPTVQVGDPFTEKLLLEACLELMQTDAIIGIQDMGAAGLTCSSFEMADRANMGMKLNLDLVPQREENMSAYEMLLSESQERMLMVAKKGQEHVAKAICDKWDIDMAVVGEVTDTGRMEIVHHGEKVVDILVAPICNEAPIYDRPASEPIQQKTLQALQVSEIPETKDLNKIFYQLIGSANLGSKAWVWEQYDHMVRTNSLVLPGGDAAVLRIKGGNKAIAMKADCNSRYCYLDPYLGAQLAVAECARNLSCVGAEPLAVTNCLNFGNPQRPEIMWQLKRAIQGLGDACRFFQTPVTGGNVSLYNETSGEGVYPTPVIAMVGLLEDASKHCTHTWKNPGDLIIMLGKFAPEFGGSEYLKQVHGKVAGTPPNLNLEAELAVQKTCRALIARGLAQSAHDVAEGGIAVALAECSLGRKNGLLGCRVELSNDLRQDLVLFGEQASLILVSVKPADLDKALTIAQQLNAPAQVIGEVGGRSLSINQSLNVDFIEAQEKWASALQRIVS